MSTPSNRSHWIGVSISYISRRIGVIVLLGVAVFLGFMLGGAPSQLEGEGSSLSVSMDDHAGHDGMGEMKQTQVWTCPMHPHVRKPGPGPCPVCGMDLLSVESGQVMTESNNPVFTTSESALALMNIQTSPVERRFAPTEIRMVGQVDFDETQIHNVTSRVAGRIDRMYVDYTGVEVTKGDHLVYLYSPELLATQEELRRAAEAVQKLSASSPKVLRTTAQSGLEASRDKLRRWGLTDKQIHEAEEKGITSDHITIYAPDTGTVIHIESHEGMYVKEGSHVYTIVDLDSVWVKLEAYESDLQWLHLGQKMAFSTEAYPGREFTGTITFIDPILDASTRTVKVRVNVNNKKRLLKPGMFVRAVVRAQVATEGRIMDPGLAGKWISPMHPEIVKDGPGKCDICGISLVSAEELGYVSASVTEDDKPLVIPASAPLITGTRAIVYVVVPDSSSPAFEGREIVLGPRTGDYYIVREGLHAGERVVTNGNFKIDSALQIQALPSMMSPDGGGGMSGGHEGMGH